MTLTKYSDYQKLFENCVLYLDGLSPTLEVIGNHTITNYNSVTVTGTNKFGQTNHALEFNGTNCLTIPHDATNLVFGTSNFGILLRFYKSSATSRMDLLTKMVPSTGYASISIIHQNGNLIFYMSYSGTSWDIFSGITVACSVGEWHTLLVYRNGTGIYACLDGVTTLLGTTSLSFGDSNTNYWEISGNQYDSARYYWTGYVGEIAMWKGTYPDPKTLYQLTSKKYLYPVMSGVRSCE